ncbi:MAG: hypothetical protein EOO63_03710 [Hymenobacter sp.]|nr:MAG: hypothetical protein EOO63_03710 [Hymenobacter sp.]
MLEPLFSFMIRVRVPSGVAPVPQWQRMHTLADAYASGTLKLTTRQTFQLHGVPKSDLPTLWRSAEAQYSGRAAAT